jgi:hypothetical protein
MLRLRPAACSPIAEVNPGLFLLGPHLTQHPIATINTGAWPQSKTPKSHCISQAGDLASQARPVQSARRRQVIDQHFA